MPIKKIKSARRFTLALVFVCGLLAPVVKAEVQTAPQSQALRLTVGGVERSYLLFRPSGTSRRDPVPLVIFLHGGFGSGEQGEKSYGWDQEATKEGFVVAYPDGLNRAWNAGGACCGRPAADGVDDLGFITALITEVSRNENIDSKRVYLTGMSNGAVMSYRYACEGTYPVAAIGPVSGSLAAPCLKPHALSVLEIHGKLDRNIPIKGGVGDKGVTKVDWLPVEEALRPFRTAASCGAVRDTTEGAVETEGSLCRAGREVTLVAIEGAGHQWPGTTPSRRPGLFFHPDPPSTALDATETLWHFFQRHPEGH